MPYGACRDLVALMQRDIDPASILNPTLDAFARKCSLSIIDNTHSIEDFVNWFYGSIHPGLGPPMDAWLAFYAIEQIEQIRTIARDRWKVVHIEYPQGNVSMDELHRLLYRGFNYVPDSHSDPNDPSPPPWQPDLHMPMSQDPFFYDAEEDRMQYRGTVALHPRQHWRTERATFHLAQLWRSPSMPLPYDLWALVGTFFSSAITQRNANRLLRAPWVRGIRVY